MIEDKPARATNLTIRIVTGKVTFAPWAEQKRRTRWWLHT